MDLIGADWRGRALLLTTTLFLAYADRATSVALAPILGAGFGLSDAQLGVLNGPALILPFSLASLLFGAGLVRAAPARIMAGCVAAWTGAAVVFACAQTYEQLVLGRMLMGVGQAGLLPAAVAALGMGAPMGRLSWLTTGTALGRSGGLLAVGVLLALATSGAGALLGIEAWRLASLMLLLPNGLVAILLWRLPDDRREGSGVPSGMGQVIRHMRGRSLAYGPHFLAAAAILVVVQAGGAWMPSLLVRGAGLTTAEAAVAAGIIVLIGAPIGHLGAGRLSARVSPPLLLAVAAVGAVIACAIVVGATERPAVMLGLLLLVISGGGGASAALIGLQPLAPVGLRPSVTAVYLGVVTLVAYAVGPLATGLLSDAMAGEATGLARGLLMVTATASAFCLLAALGGLKAWRNGVLRGTGA